MKNIIIAVLVAFIFNVNASANPVIMAELQKMEAAAELRLAAKDSQIAELAAEIVAKDSQIAELAAEIAAKDSQIKNPDLETAVKIKFNQAMVDAKTSITKITEEIISKLKGGK